MESTWRLFSRLFPSKGHDDIPTTPSSTSRCLCSRSSAILNGKRCSSSRFSAVDKVDCAAACEVIYSTMKALNFKFSVNYDHPLFPDSEKYWDSLNLDAPTRAYIRKIARSSVAMGDLAYPFLPRDNRLAIGIFTTYLVWIDDGVPAQELQLFRFHCTTDRSKLSTGLQHFVSYLDHLASFYGPHGGDMIWSATFQFVNACIVEEIHGKAFDIPRSAVLFPRYQRSKGGFAEAFAYAVFCQADFPEDDWLKRYMLVVPDLMESIDFGNDVMSFYKEHVIGDEQFTFIWNYSFCHGKPLIDGLKDTVSCMLNAVERMRRTAADQPKILARIEMFLQGYASWHWFNDGRYHLHEIHEPHATESK